MVVNESINMELNSQFRNRYRSLYLCSVGTVTLKVTPIDRTSKFIVKMHFC